VVARPAPEGALAGRAGLQDGGPCHPDDLPEGVPRGRPWAERGKVGRGCGEGRPRAPARSVWRQVDGMALSRRGGEGAPPEYPRISMAEAHAEPMPAACTLASPRSVRGVTADIGTPRK
jgi:hypothetical protein